MSTQPATFGTLDLSTLSEAERLSFYGALFAMSAADRSMDPSETDRIFESLDLSDVSPEGRKRVFSQAIQPPPLERCLLAFKDAEPRIRRGLMLNLIDIVLADESIEPGEHLGLHQARQLLGLTRDEVSELHNVAYAAHKAGRVTRPIGLPDDHA